MQTQELLEKLSKLDKPTFIGLKGYTNSLGETSNRSILINFNYYALKERDLQTLEENKKWIMKKLGRRFHQDVIEIAYREIRNSLKQEKESPYESLAPGIKVNKYSGELYLHGLSITKKVTNRVNYLQRAKKDVNIIKETIIKLLDLKTNKYRIFKLKPECVTLR